VPAAIARHPAGPVLLPAARGACPFLLGPSVVGTAPGSTASGSTGRESTGRESTGRESTTTGSIATEGTRAPSVPASSLSAASSGAPLAVCAIHAKLGPRAKPRVCSQFPFGLVATPTGGRATTSHRCPCRTLGDRPPITAASAAAALATGGRLRAGVRVASRIAIRAGSSVPFSEYEAIERGLLAALAAGGDAPAVLARLAGQLRGRTCAEPLFPRLQGASWRRVGAAFARAETESSYGATLAWLGEALVSIHGGRRGRWPIRPWAEAFARAAERTPAPPASRAGRKREGSRVVRERDGSPVVRERDGSPVVRERDGSPVACAPASILLDWAADEIWALEWPAHATLAQLVGQLAALTAIGGRITSVLRGRGIRADIAEAEAVTILDLASGSELWQAVQKAWPAR
jgi:hypothetical protein